jgi:hypothetical protein
MSGRGSINANNSSNKNQQQKIQKDLRDANKATRVLLTVPPHPNAARQRKELKTINAALLCDPCVLASCPRRRSDRELTRLLLLHPPRSVAAFVVALLAFLLEYASLAWLAAFMTVVRRLLSGSLSRTSNKITLTLSLSYSRFTHLGLLHQRRPPRSKHVQESCGGGVCVHFGHCQNLSLLKPPDAY